MAHPDTTHGKRKVQRLVDVDVSHVSLVDRPANRTPFKAIKRDGETQTEGKSMNITLKNMFGSRPAEITSVMADTAPKALAVAKMLMEGEGVLSEADGTHIVTKKGHTISADDKIVHMGKSLNVAYGITGLKKELDLYGMDSQSFDETLKAEGFVPGIFIGLDALSETLRKVAMNENTKSPADFQKGAATAIQDFTKYIDSLIGALPEKAFKFEKAVLSVISPNPIGFTTPAGEGFNTDVYDALFAEDAKEAPKEATEAAPVEAPEAEAPKEEAAPVAPAEAAPVAPEAPKAEAAPANLEELPKTQKDDAPDLGAALAEAMAELSKKMGEQMAAAIAPVSERMAKQDAALASLSKAMGSTIAGTPEADEDNVVSLSKGTGQRVATGDIPLMDTAYRASKKG